MASPLTAASRFFVALAMAAMVLPGCTGKSGGATDTPAIPAFALYEAEMGGLSFEHHNGASGELAMYEIIGAGAALLDYDNDGDLDVYLVQSGAAPGSSPANGTDQLFRNDLESAADGAHRLRFSDVTQQAGITATGYGMGVATGDYDNDAWVDLYVTNFGFNQLWRNNGDGSFENVTAIAGVAGPDVWSTSAAFVDFDADGFLDLVVANYIAESLTDPIRCTAANSARDYCSPLNYPAVANRLYRNGGDGTFSDVTDSAGLGAVARSSLGVVAGDFNRDGKVDIYVANDAMENELWVNAGAGMFTEQALINGAAVNANGEPEAGMGVTAGDFDEDGDLDLFVTHLRGETNTLYVNDGAGRFSDRTIAAQLGPPSLRYTGFGTNWFDYDNDGWLDLLVVNGAVRNYGKPMTAAVLAERNQLYHSRGDGTFAEQMPGTATEVMQLVEVSRGAAFGDIDNDGDTDVLVTNNNGPARLLINEAAGHHHWLGLSLRAGDPPADTNGVQVIVEIAGPGGQTRQRWRTAARDGSYLSAHDPRILVGLGTATQVVSVRVLWANGVIEQWQDLDIDRYHDLLRGTGMGIGQ